MDLEQRTRCEEAKQTKTSSEAQTIDKGQIEPQGGGRTETCVKSVNARMTIDQAYLKTTANPGQ